MQEKTLMDTTSNNILHIEGGTSRPTVLFNSSTGQFRLLGRSILENSIAFYEPIVRWIESYIRKPASLTEFHMELEYFNTSTSKYILQIMQLFESLCDCGCNVVIVWYYADEDMLELGNDYQQIVKVPFEYRELKFD